LGLEAENVRKNRRIEIFFELLFNTTAKGEFYGIRNVAEGFYQEMTSPLGFSLSNGALG